MFRTEQLLIYLLQRVYAHIWPWWCFFLSHDRLICIRSLLQSPDPGATVTVLEHRVDNSGHRVHNQTPHKWRILAPPNRTIGSYVVDDAGWGSSPPPLIE
jgi:hypothetical protein